MQMRKRFSSVLSAMLIAAFGAPALAMADSPVAEPDDSWVTVSGTVVETMDGGFTLDYGEGLITVEMDDWDWYEEGEALIGGDEVTVSGTVDNDLMESRKIEAGSVYVDDLNTYFYASAADEDVDPYVTSALDFDAVDNPISLTGEVKSESGREFTLDTGEREIKIDTLAINYNPLDDIGFQKLDKGERVTVYGEMDADFFEANELMADNIITLEFDEGKNQS